MSKLIDVATGHLPLWSIGILLLVVFIGACEVGRLVTARLDRRLAKNVQSDHTSPGYVVTAVFALLAFMLATTFSMALSRFDTRRMALAQEVDAIGTAYDRASMLDEPEAELIRALLREYAHCRISSPDWSAAQLETRAEVCRKIGEHVWLETRKAVLPVRTTALASYVISATNDVLNSSVRRDIAGRAVIPGRVLSVLLLCTIAASAALGSVQAGSPVRHRGSSSLLLALYAVCFVLILDIDRSRTGSVAVSQRPMQALANQLDSDVR